MLRMQALKGLFTNNSFDHRPFQFLARRVISEILPDEHDDMIFIATEQDLIYLIDAINQSIKNRDNILDRKNPSTPFVKDPKYITMLLPIIQRINELYRESQTIVDKNHELYNNWERECSKIRSQDPNQFAQKGENDGKEAICPPEPAMQSIEYFSNDVSFWMKKYVVDDGKIQYTIPDNMKGGKTKEHVPNAKKQTKWVSTGKKTVVAIKQGKKKVNVERVIYSNAKGDLRIRKITIMDDKTRQVKYIKF
jgi:hypothetical protein